MVASKNVSCVFVWKRLGINLCTLVMTRPTEKYNPRDMTLHCKERIGVNLYEIPVSKKPCCIVGSKSFFSFCPKSEIALVKILILTSMICLSLRSTSNLNVASTKHLIWPSTFVKTAFR